MDQTQKLPTGISVLFIIVGIFSFFLVLSSLLGITAYLILPHQNATIPISLLWFFLFNLLYAVVLGLSFILRKKWLLPIIVLSAIESLIGFFASLSIVAVVQLLIYGILLIVGYKYRNSLSGKYYNWFFSTAFILLAIVIGFLGSSSTKTFESLLSTNSAANPTTPQTLSNTQPPAISTTTNPITQVGNIYTDPQGNFQFTIPSGWHNFPSPFGGTPLLSITSSDTKAEFIITGGPAQQTLDAVYQADLKKGLNVHYGSLDGQQAVIGSVSQGSLQLSSTVFIYNNYGYVFTFAMDSSATSTNANLKDYNSTLSSLTFLK